MDAQITLNLNKEILDEAKNYAKERGVSLSQIIESYLSILIQNKDDEGFSPAVKKLSGILSESQIAEGKTGYGSHLKEKYSK